MVGVIKNFDESHVSKKLMLAQTIQLFASFYYVEYIELCGTYSTVMKTILLL